MAVMGKFVKPTLETDPYTLDRIKLTARYHEVIFCPAHVFGKPILKALYRDLFVVVYAYRQPADETFSGDEMNSAAAPQGRIVMGRTKDSSSLTNPSVEFGEGVVFHHGRVEHLAVDVILRT